MKKHIRLWLYILVLLVLVICCAGYVNDYYHANQTALEALIPTEHVSVIQQEDMVLFLPEQPSAGFIFYPGGKVEHTAYAPLMMALAQQNILCIIPRMPLNLAVLDSGAAQGIPEQFPEVPHWFIGGHSLGGSMAASYAAEHTGEFSGLVLLAAYSTADLSQAQLPVISLYGSEDQVLNMEKYEDNRVNLPSGISEIVIAGGNHAGFGSYGPQEGDGEAAVSGEAQTAQTAAALLHFFGA